MRKVWVVVANQSEAKIYRAQDTDTLIEHALLFHEEGTQRAEDLVCDKQGSFHGAYGAESVQGRTSLKAKENHFFAVQIAHFLEKGVQRQEVERIYLIAKSPFIGALVDALKPAVAKLVAAEIHKDVLSASLQQIRDYLPPAL